VFGSVQPQPLDNQPDGTLLLSDIEAAIKPDDIHYARDPAAGAGEHLERQAAADDLRAGCARACACRAG
jgi:threonine aldolase